MKEHNILGVILAGGKSSRFGSNKSLSKLANYKLIEQKLKSYTHHREYDLNPIGIDNIKKRIENRESVYNLNVVVKSKKLHKIQSIISFLDFYDKIYIKSSNKTKHKIEFDGPFSKNIKVRWPIRNGKFDFFAPNAFFFTKIHIFTTL